MIRFEFGPTTASIQASLSTGKACTAYLTSPQGQRSNAFLRGNPVPASQATRLGNAPRRVPKPWRGLLQGCAGLAACMALGSQGVAQDSFHVSLTSTRTVGSLRIDDASLVRADATGSLSPVLSEGHWQGLLGYVPSDVDAFSRRQGFDAQSAASMGFSFLTDRAGFLDGDVLSFAPGGGLQVLLSEMEILAALGVPTANLDLDALDLGTVGRVYFSLQSDLSGTVLGDIKDGDVLFYDEGSRSVFLHTTEDDFQAAFTLATGSLSAIGEVLGICFDAGELHFTVQSPSSFDGAVFSLEAGGTLVRDELSMGLGGAELSALHPAQVEELPCCYFDQFSAAAGDTLQLSVHGKPGTIYAALLAGNTGFIDFSRKPGWGAIAMDRSDTWLMGTLSMSNLPFLVTDSQGNFTGSFTFPTAPLYGRGFSNEEGWSFQMLEVPGLKLSAPYRVLKN